MEKLKPKRWQLWLCKFLGWHKVGSYHYKDNDPLKFQRYGNCIICGKKDLMQDSQGNWF